MKIKIQKLHPDAVVPYQATQGAACFDLCAIGVTRHQQTNAWRVLPSEPIVFRTGLAFEIPPGWAMLIYSRSGHGFRNAARLSNAVGVIDSDYRGEVMVSVHCDAVLGMQRPEPLIVRPGDRIAQAMLVQVPDVRFVVVDELGKTKRGTGGLGSTGQSTGEQNDEGGGDVGQPAAA